MHRKHNAAFTLIELLVVIAIIAILAAILFPVFAQAREKARQTACLSNVKQLGTASLMYLQDCDEQLPMAYGKYAGYWDFSYLMDVPANWRKTSTQADIDDFNSYWGNSTYAYTKNYQLLACPSTPLVTTYAGTSTSYNAPPAAVTYTYNGDLHSYLLAGIVNPSACPLIWEGDGKAKLKGSQWANPQMYCGSGDCVYKPVVNGSCSGNGCIDYLWQDGDTDGPMDIHTGGQIFVYTDGHAKWRRMGAVVTPARTDVMTDPYCTYDKNGYSKLSWYDAAYYHAFLFRPDYDFTTVQKGFCGY